MRQVGLLGDRQRVHVRPQRDRPRGSASRQGADHAGAAMAAPDRKAELGQLSGDEIAGPALLIGKLGVAMEIAAPPARFLDQVVREFAAHETVPRSLTGKE
jgi:hypothetical protein